MTAALLADELAADSAGNGSSADSAGTAGAAGAGSAVAAGGSNRAGAGAGVHSRCKQESHCKRGMRDRCRGRRRLQDDAAPCRKRRRCRGRQSWRPLPQPAIRQSATGASRGSQRWKRGRCVRRGARDSRGGVSVRPRAELAQRRHCAAGAVSRPHLRVQGFRRRLPGRDSGAATRRRRGRRGRTRRRPGGGAGGHLRRHRRRSGACVLAPRRHRGGAAVPVRPHQPSAGAATHRARRQHPRRRGRRLVRRLPAPGEAGAGRPGAGRRGAPVPGQLDQPRAPVAAGVLLPLRRPAPA